MVLLSVLPKNDYAIAAMLFIDIDGDCLSWSRLAITCRSAYGICLWKYFGRNPNVDHTEPDSESDEDYDYIPHKWGRSFCARGLRSFVNPLNKLRYGHAFTLVLEFLGNYQLKTRKR